MQIYIHRDGRQFGPYSIDVVREHLASGVLAAEDLAWHEGAADWQPLHQLLEETEAVPVADPETALEVAPEPVSEPEPESAPVPEVAPEPEPEPAPARGVTPSWVPARRDGAAAAPISKPDRLPLPGAAWTPPVEKPAPVQQTPAASPPAQLSPPPRPKPVDPPSAQGLAQPVNTRTRAPRRLSGDVNPFRGKAIRNIVVGGLFFFGGTAVTALTYQEAASHSGGGTYIVAWGAILFGGIQLLSGVVLFFKE